MIRLNIVIRKDEQIKFRTQFHEILQIFVIFEYSKQNVDR
jgi:hypothetical protein